MRRSRSRLSSTRAQADPIPRRRARARPIELDCRACGSRVRLFPGPRAGELSRECLACPVCWATGAPLDDAALAPHRRVMLSRTRSYRLLGCLRPGGMELEGASSEELALAEMLWRLACRR